MSPWRPRVPLENGLTDVVEFAKQIVLWFRLNDSRSKDLFFITYVPDTASVRDKMLYAAAKTNLLKNLPTIESRLASSIFATSPVRSHSEISYMWRDRLADSKFD